MSGVVGLDLSMARTGMCYIPSQWDFSRESLVSRSVTSERDGAARGDPHVLAKLEIERFLKIAKGVVGFTKECGVRHVAAERYAYSKGQSSSATRLAELGGIVKSQLLLSCRAPAVSVAVNSARSFLTGGLKRGKQKQQVEVFLSQRGFFFDNYDEMDAFVISFYWYCKINELENPLLPQQTLGI